jgi:diaminohydroxyphosphoribosylaminopyrimidine deaminase / 5-amino-6-(5-phosphoribosylamino)uracil reductase
VARVVYAIADPNPQVNGRGAAALREAGISVESGLLEAEAHELNAGFVKRMQQGRPFVRVKLAMSVDGRTALANGQSKWITGESARQDVHAWRARSSAILTGIGTVLRDDPRLDVRLPAPAGLAQRRQPLRVVLDSQLRTPPAAQLFGVGGEVMILTGLAALDEARAAALSARGARVESLPAGDGGVELTAVLDRLGELEVNELFVEAGATLAGGLLRQHLADELIVYVAPKFLGPAARGLVELPELTALDGAAAFVFLEATPVGEDLRLRLRPKPVASA